MKWNYILPILSVLFLYSCIGVDEVDLSSPLNQKIVIDNSLKQNTQWDLNEKRFLKATYFNIHSKPEETTLEWFSSDTTILKISGDSVKAIGIGEAFIFAKKNNVFSDSTLINVIDRDIFISITNQEILKGNTAQVSVTIKNNDLKDKTVSWKSSNESIATIDANGKITAIKKGTSIITAMIDEFVSNEIMISVTELASKTAFFTTTTSYKTEGTVILQETADGKLQLVFQSDTYIQNGPSLYLLLANKITPPFTLKTDGTSLAIDGISAQITPNRLDATISGTKTFDIPSGVKINDYKYVVFYCTFGPVFGSAELK